MPFDLVPRSFFDFSRFPTLFDEDEFLSLGKGSGLTVSEDEKSVYVEAAVPGVDPKKVDVSYDKGILWIRGSAEEKEEDKKKKYYRKASASFSYHLTVPGNIEKDTDPEVTYKNGVVKVTFKKVTPTQPKKLSIKEE